MNDNISNVDVVDVNNENNILITGGNGYIGSHIALECLKGSNKQITKVTKVIILDNLSQTNYNIDKIINYNIENVKKNYANKVENRVKFVQVDLCNYEELKDKLSNLNIKTVVHCAAYKSVKKGQTEPISYYENNLLSTINILKWMVDNKVRNFIFSGSATVYASEKMQIKNKENKNHKFTEEEIIEMPVSVYGKTKWMNEIIIKDICSAHDIKCICFRYFNPIGYIIPENPKVKEPENLIPYIVKVVNGELEKLTVFGNDYNNNDGTPIRDYIHIEDLARAHVLGIEGINNLNEDFTIINLGSDNGYSVLQLIESFERCNNIKVPYIIGDRRDGDVGYMVADSSKAKTLLNWECTKNLDDMCKDSLLF